MLSKGWENAIEVFDLGLARCQDAGLYQCLAYCLENKGNLEIIARQVLILGSSSPIRD